MAEQFWAEILSFAACCKSLLVGSAHTSISYQNTVYNAARVPQTISEPAKNPFVTLNMEASTSNDVPEELWPPGGGGPLAEQADDHQPDHAENKDDLHTIQKRDLVNPRVSRRSKAAGGESGNVYEIRNGFQQTGACESADGGEKRCI